MMILRRWTWLLAGSLAFCSMGCGELWHNLQPHRMHRLNRVPNAMESNAYNFSIPDPDVPVSGETADSQHSTASCSSNICAE